MWHEGKEAGIWKSISSRESIASYATKFVNIRKIKLNSLSIKNNPKLYVLNEIDPLKRRS